MPGVNGVFFRVVACHGTKYRAARVIDRVRPSIEVVLHILYYTHIKLYLNEQLKTHHAITLHPFTPSVISDLLAS